MNPPQPPALDAAAQTARIVKELFNLPVHEDSSALRRMDAWVIADYIAAAVQAESRKLLERLLQHQHVYNVKSTDGELNEPNTGVLAVPIDAITALLDSEQQKLGGK